MLGIDDIRGALIDYLQSKTTITSLVSATETRENQWQGVDFTYPCVRVKVNSATPQQAGECDIFDCPISIIVKSEQASSAQADNIAGIINTVLHRRSFDQSGVRFMIWTTRLSEAIREDTRTWRAEVLIQATVNG